MDKQKLFNTRYLINTRRYLLISVALVIASVALVSLVVIPRFTASLKVFQSIQDSREIVEKLEKKSLDLQQVSRSRFMAQSGEINQLMPSRKPLLELLQGLNAVAVQTNVLYTDISLSPGKIATESASENEAEVRTRSSRTPTKKSDTETLDISLKVSGSLNQINDFLKTIESTAPFTTVTTMKLIEQKAVESFERAPFQADLTLSSHFFTQPISVVVHSPLPKLTDKHEKTLNVIDDFIYPTFDEQQAIEGGGLEDLFGVEGIELLNQ